MLIELFPHRPLVCFFRCREPPASAGDSVMNQIPKMSHLPCSLPASPWQWPGALFQWLHLDHPEGNKRNECHYKRYTVHATGQDGNWPNLPNLDSICDSAVVDVTSHTRARTPRSVHPNPWQEAAKPLSRPRCPQFQPDIDESKTIHGFRVTQES